MAGAFIEGMTDPMIRHMQETAAYAGRLGEGAGRSLTNLVDTFASLGGEVYQALSQGHENWYAAAVQKGREQAQWRSDTGVQVVRHYEDLNMNQLHGLAPVNMPTA